MRDRCHPQEHTDSGQMWDQRVEELQQVNTGNEKLKHWSFVQQSLLTNLKINLLLTNRMKMCRQENLDQRSFINVQVLCVLLVLYYWHTCYLLFKYPPLVSVVHLMPSVLQTFSSLQGFNRVPWVKAEESWGRTAKCLTPSNGAVREIQKWSPCCSWQVLNN